MERIQTRKGDYIENIFYREELHDRKHIRRRDTKKKRLYMGKKYIERE